MLFLLLNAQFHFLATYHGFQVWLMAKRQYQIPDQRVINIRIHHA